MVVVVAQMIMVLKVQKLQLMTFRTSISVHRIATWNQTATISIFKMLTQMMKKVQLLAIFIQLLQEIPQILSQSHVKVTRDPFPSSYSALSLSNLYEKSNPCSLNLAKNE